MRFFSNLNLSLTKLTVSHHREKFVQKKSSRDNFGLKNRNLNVNERQKLHHKKWPHRECS